MGAVTVSMILGYMLGILSPAKLIAKRKNTDLQELGTGNLGATNTMLVFGVKHGVLVMLFDIFKGYLSVKLARLLFPKVAIAGLAAGCAAVVGHMFPFYLHFRGGKGVAAFGGMILAVDPLLFPILLINGIILAFLVDYCVAVPLSAALLFPILITVRTRSLTVFGLTFGIGILLVIKHLINLERIRSGEEIRLRSFLKEKLHS